MRGLDARVAGDIGCYTLAAVEPLRSIDTTVCMGASIGNAIGMAAAGEKKPIVATIGDSTFLHSGIPPLIDAVYNKANVTVVILDNAITAMTGGQDHPGTGRTLARRAGAEGRLRGDLPAVGVNWSAGSTRTMSATCTRPFGRRSRTGCLGRHLRASLRARSGQDQGRAARGG